MKGRGGLSKKGSFPGGMADRGISGLSAEEDWSTDRSIALSLGTSEGATCSGGGMVSCSGGGGDTGVTVPLSGEGERVPDLNA